MKVLVSDPLAEQGIDLLRGQEGIEVDVDTGLTEDELVARICDYDALIVRSQTRVTERVITAGKKLRSIGRAGVGVDNIDVEAATRSGIVVLNAPEGNTIAAVEHTMAMLLALARNLPQAYVSLRSAKWDRKSFTGVQLEGKTLGVIGFGRIGSEVARRAVAFGMHVLCSDPFISPERARKIGTDLVGLSELLAGSDFITLHIPRTKETEHLIGGPEISLMKDGVRIINCARGGVIDEQALFDALKSGKVAGAALDVFKKEPPMGSPLLGLDSVIATPHLGASTEEAQVTVAVHVATEIIKVLKGEAFKNAVNVPYLSPEMMAKLAPYVPLAEALGRFYTGLVGGGHDKIQITYAGEIAEYDVTLLTTAALKGVLNPVLHEEVNLVNARWVAEERGIKIAEIKERNADGARSIISLKGKATRRERCVAATLSENNVARLILIDNYRMDIAPSGRLLVIYYTDRPGVIGQVGTILGRNGINIAYMQVGRMVPGGEAVMALGIDDPVPDKVVAEVSKVSHITEARRVEW